MTKDSLLHHILSITESSYFKYSSQRWKNALVKRYFSGWGSWRNSEQVVNSWGDLWARQWFRTVPTEFYGKLGKDTHSSEEWSCFQRPSPWVKPFRVWGHSGFYAQGSIRRAMAHTTYILLFLIMEVPL